MTCKPFSLLLLEFYCFWIPERENKPQLIQSCYRKLTFFSRMQTHYMHLHEYKALFCSCKIVNSGYNLQLVVKVTKSVHTREGSIKMKTYVFMANDEVLHLVEDFFRSCRKHVSFHTRMFGLDMLRNFLLATLTSSTHLAEEVTVAQVVRGDVALDERLVLEALRTHLARELESA